MPGCGCPTCALPECDSAGCGKRADSGFWVGRDFAGAKALVDFAAFSARLKSCPVTKHEALRQAGVFPQPVKPAAKKHRECSIGVEGARVFCIGTGDWVLSLDGGSKGRPALGNQGDAG
jgi:hypothetical protein